MHTTSLERISQKKENKKQNKIKTQTEHKLGRNKTLSCLGVVENTKNDISYYLSKHEKMQKLKEK